jgi:putative cell wall-binding protein
MSPKVREQLKAYIRELIQQEIEEASTTATAGAMHYSTPYAFSGKGKKDRRKKIAKQSGYKLEGKFHVKVQDLGSVLVDAGSKGEAKMKVAKQLKKRKDIVSVTRVGVSKAKQVDKKLENVNEGKYHDWRNDETLSPKQKIGKSMMEVRDTLRELEKMVKMNVRLKNELNVDSRGYWKRTHSALQKISERLVKLANKVGQLK